MRLLTSLFSSFTEFERILHGFHAGRSDDEFASTKIRPRETTEASVLFRPHDFMSGLFHFLLCRNFALSDAGSEVLWSHLVANPMKFCQSQGIRKPGYGKIGSGYYRKEIANLLSLKSNLVFFT